MPLHGKFATEYTRYDWSHLTLTSETEHLKKRKPMMAGSPPRTPLWELTALHRPLVGGSGLAAPSLGSTGLGVSAIRALNCRLRSLSHTLFIFPSSAYGDRPIPTTVFLARFIINFLHDSAVGGAACQVSASATNADVKTLKVAF